MILEPVYYRSLLGALLVPELSDRLIAGKGLLHLLWAMMSPDFLGRESGACPVTCASQTHFRTRFDRSSFLDHRFLVVFSHDRAAFGVLLYINQKLYWASFSSNPGRALNEAVRSQDVLDQRSICR